MTNTLNSLYAMILFLFLFAIANEVRGKTFFSYLILFYTQFNFNDTFFSSCFTYQHFSNPATQILSVIQMIGAIFLIMQRVTLVTVSAYSYLLLSFFFSQLQKHIQYILKEL